MDTQQQEFWKEQREFNRKMIQRLDEGLKRDRELFVMMRKTSAMITDLGKVVSALGDRIYGQR